MRLNLRFHQLNDGLLNLDGVAVVRVMIVDAVEHMIRGRQRVDCDVSPFCKAVYGLERDLVRQFFWDIICHAV